MKKPLTDEEVQKKGIAYWQDKLAKFFPRAPGPTGTELIMFAEGYRSGEQDALARKVVKGPWGGGNGAA